MVQKKSSPPKRAASTLVNFEIFPSPGVAAVWVGGIPAGIAAVRRYANGRRFHQRFLETAVVVQGDDGAGGTVVVDPLHVPHTEAYTSGGSAGAEFVVLPCLQRGLVLPVIRHGVEQVRTGNARGILPVDAAIERPPDILVGGLESPRFRGRCILPARRHKRLHRLRELAGSIQAIHNDEVLRRVDRNAIVMTALVGAGVCASIDEGVVDFGRYIANGTAVCDGPVGSKRADSSVHGEVHLAGTDVPVPVLVPGDACVGEVHLPRTHVPPAEGVPVHACGAEVYLAVLDAPPAHLVVGDTGVIEVHLAALDAPPAVFILGNAGVVKVHIALCDLPPAKPVLGNAGVRGVDDAITSSHPDAVDLCDLDALGGGGHAAVVRGCGFGIWLSGRQESVQLRNRRCQVAGPKRPQKAAGHGQSQHKTSHCSVMFLYHCFPLLRHLFYPNYTGKCYLSQEKAESREQAFNLLVRRLLIFDLVRLLK